MRSVVSAKECAKSIIINHLNTGTTAEALYGLFEIRSGNNDVLLEHVKALKGIFEQAIKEIEKEIKDERKNERL